ncbi:hypothetical protein EDS67_00760 [candidate division KSB1 bacterium]|nr:MAG: hypothetical protein EDS67_00760 [candidate division KSB1 bacterium]MBC6951225.1 hypothetical protein [candidate division KSB1 bacterium]MCE7941600.1 hypothetical protein [Chlorobi bacterium CHB1]MDL1875948.1 hypothetical protein [Cytophagia bacterium CHB2]
MKSPEFWPQELAALFQMMRVEPIPARIIAEAYLSTELCLPKSIHEKSFDLFKHLLRVCLIAMPLFQPFSLVIRHNIKPRIEQKRWFQRVIPTRELSFARFRLPQTFPWAIPEYNIFAVLGSLFQAWPDYNARKFF